jgi:hypothetical protein
MKICPKCERPASNGVPKCRGCGHVYTGNYTFVDDKPTVRKSRIVQKPNKKNAHRNENNRKLSRLPEPEPGKFYISMFKK